MSMSRATISLSYHPLNNQRCNILKAHTFLLAETETLMYCRTLCQMPYLAKLILKLSAFSSKRIYWYILYICCSMLLTSVLVSPPQRNKMGIKLLISKKQNIGPTSTQVYAAQQVFVILQPVLHYGNSPNLSSTVRLAFPLRSCKNLVIIGSSFAMNFLFHGPA